MRRTRQIGFIGLLALCGLLAGLNRAALGAWAFSVTGEEQPLAQARALWHLAVGALRPPLDLRPETPIQHNGVNPFGINTFLQQEVEVSKREQQVRLIAEAGFHWLRQEFPWADIEISGKGNFEDCRNAAASGGCISAWEKYDNLVALAEQYELEMLVRLSSPPSWSRADGDARGAFAPPDNIGDFADYAEAVARRYAGRLRYYQIWNEPNIFPEWGDQPADPEAYTRLLCAAHARLKSVDPAIVVVAAPLAPTNPLGLVNAATNAAAELNDFVYLQRMYQAGAGACFDVMSVQGYGLGSGPTDQRLRPLQFNYARNLFIRDLMVKNGDSHKAIWIAEVNWNAAPEAIPSIFGRVTEVQQARYAPLAYERAQAEWPWVGANFFWFFKRASDTEKDQAWYYFRMAEPDFTLLPVYQTMKDYLATARVIYPGWFQEDHWAVEWRGDWKVVHDDRYTFGKAKMSEGQASLRFTFEGSEVVLLAAGPDAGASEACAGEPRSGSLSPPCGALEVRVNGGSPSTFNLQPEITRLPLARSLPAGRHTVEVVATGSVTIDGFIVRRAPDLAPGLALLLGVVLALLALRRPRAAAERR